MRVSLHCFGLRCLHFLQELQRAALRALVLLGAKKAVPPRGSVAWRCRLAPHGNRPAAELMVGEDVVETR